MTQKQIEKIIKQASKIQLLDASTILIAPLKTRTSKVKEFEPVDGKQLVSAKLDSEIKDTKVKEVEREVKLEYQEAILIALAPDLKLDIKLGDTIVYNIHAVADFDYIKGVQITKVYNIIGVVK